MICHNCYSNNEFTISCIVIDSKDDRDCIYCVIKNLFEIDEISLRNSRQKLLQEVKPYLDQHPEIGLEI